MTLNVFAQSTDDKYIMMKPLSWDELQLYQLDSLLTTKELHLSPHCPTTLNKLQDTYNKTSTHMQYILGTNYIWSEFSNDQGLKCLVKHDKIDSITPNNSVESNPNAFVLLNTLQARILTSASLGIGDKKKERSKKMMEANKHNQKLRDKKYEKYGGLENLIKFIRENKLDYPTDPVFLKNRRTYSSTGSVTLKSIPLIDIFEIGYSDESKAKFFQLLKKKPNSK
jgi:hypothetical protein